MRTAGGVDQTIALSPRAHSVGTRRVADVGAQMKTFAGVLRGCCSLRWAREVAARVFRRFGTRHHTSTGRSAVYSRREVRVAARLLSAISATFVVAAAAASSRENDVRAPLGRRRHRRSSCAQSIEVALFGVLVGMRGLSSVAASCRERHARCFRHDLENAGARARRLQPPWLLRVATRCGGELRRATNTPSAAVAGVTTRRDAPLAHHDASRRPLNGRARAACRRREATVAVANQFLHCRRCRR